MNTRTVCSDSTSIKGMDLSVPLQEHLDDIARRLNQRPRQALEFGTPAETF